MSAVKDDHVVPGVVLFATFLYLLLEYPELFFATSGFREYQQDSGDQLEVSSISEEKEKQTER